MYEYAKRDLDPKNLEAFVKQGYAETQPVSVDLKALVGTCEEAVKEMQSKNAKK